ncbi:MAG TPA: hypothetical protein VJ201_02295 [Candidatus Babeliales bacterium]|nr:hypothetical protein [Candidatus Babeliales bacterium]
MEKKEREINCSGLKRVLAILFVAIGISSLSFVGFTSQVQAQGKILHKKKNAKKPKRLSKKKKKSVQTKKKVQKPKRLTKKKKKKVAKSKHAVRRKKPKSKKASKKNRHPKKRKRVLRPKIASAMPFYEEPLKNITLGRQQCQGWERPINIVTNLKQPLVLPQFGPQGGGAASCGYHALKNGMILLEFAQQKTANTGQRLVDVGLVQRLFGPEGQWRHIVINERNKNVLTFIIGQRLDQLIRPQAIARNAQLASTRNLYAQAHIDQPNRENFEFKVRFDAYKSKLRDIARNWAQEVIQRGPRDFTGRDLTNAFMQAPDFSVSIDYFPRPEGIVQGIIWTIANWRTHVIDQILHLRNPEQINGIVDVQAFDQDPLHIGTDEPFLREAYDRYNHYAQQIGAIVMGSMNGDWVNNHEIAQIIGNPVFPRVLANSIMIIQDVVNLDQADQARLGVITQRLNRGENLSQAFILGTMNIYTGGFGHWFTVVVTQQDNHREIIVADSVNHNKLGSGQVNALLRHLGVL